jgi:two-component system KDP operon response regulator KdpE
MTTILVVDDEAQIRRALDVGVRSHGYDVVQAPDGDTALDKLAAERIDIMILDLGLPGLQGSEVLRRFRAWSDAPVIILSVRAGQAEKWLFAPIRGSDSCGPAREGWAETAEVEHSQGDKRFC